MKKWAKKLVSLALAGAMLTAPAAAVTPEGENETLFDSVWSLIDLFGLKAENDPYILQNYINQYLEKHPEQLYTVLNDILSLLDTHSMYLSSEEYSRGFSTLEGFIGIGVGLRETAAGAEIVEVIRYSAAEEAGFQVGDVITAVDGASVEGMTLAEIAARVRGEAGTRLTVTVRRMGRAVEIGCVRRQVNQIYVSNATMAEGVEYIKISAIGSENDWNVFSEIWEGLDEKNTRAVILDLRGNGGGVVDVAMRIADAMVREKDAYLAGVRWREDMGGLERFVSTGGGLPLNRIVVLVDGGTASAAELLAGSLRDTGTATLLGETTYGKGQGQYHFTFPNGDKLVITTVEAELPRQGRYEGVGLTPDLAVENQVVSLRYADLAPLDTTRALRFGERSDNVSAMTERLALLGLLAGETDRFDSAVLDAVTAFCGSFDLAPALSATPEMLRTLEEAVRLLDGKRFSVDRQLQTALEICRAAARQLQQYTALPDGSWQAN